MHLMDPFGPAPRARSATVFGHDPEERAMRRAPLFLVLGLLASLPLQACSGGARAGSGSSSGEITLDEIEATTARDAYELLERLRPQWLRGRGSTSFRDPRPALPVVYVDGIRTGGTETLRRIDTGGILSMDYLGAADATTRFGTGHAGGVILVRLRR
ncbi:MAG: hypothetical protein EA350_06180 [Gemmatimonadales bacterium]|nr:MAG: hypothetical protein EA350_06180 [Gemmatimonadales bacterium]